MLRNFFCLSISIIVGIASANPDAIPSQSINEIFEYSTNLAVQETPFPLLFQSVGALTGYQKSAVSTVVGTAYWLASSVFYIITAGVISFCRLSNLCMGLEEYIPIVADMVTQALKPENLETAEKALVTVIGNFFEGSSN